MDMIFQASLGVRLKSLREAAGISVGDLARASNLDICQYINAENQGDGLTIGQLYDVARSLGTTLDFMTDGLTD